MTRDEKIAKLGKTITDRMDVVLGLEKITHESPEYWALNEVLTDEMLDVALLFKKRVPMTLAEVAKKAGKTEAELEPILQEMSVIGILEYNWENPKRIKQYILPMFVPGSAEFFMMHPTLPEEHPILADFFDAMTRLPLEKVTPMVPPGGAGIGMHVIPVEKAIPAEQKSASVEHISHWLKKYQGKYSIGNCSCRRQQRIRGEGTGDLEADWCIGVGDMADYCVETGKGRYCTYEEVMETLQRAEDMGYVHEITNIDGENKIFAICNCAPGVCNALRTSQLYNTPNMSRSAYVSESDADKCVACGKCVEVCPAGAIKLGQKLTTKNGPVEYPRQELPDAAKWGPDKWSPDFRDRNRENCHLTGTAPCKTACPAHIAVQGYIKMAGEGRYLDALKLIKQDNPFPAVCGAICNRRCEDACTRGCVDQPLAIDEIKKFVANLDLNAETRYIPKVLTASGKPMEQKIAIIGAGPAGLSCAYFLARMGYKPTVFEKTSRPGGMLMHGIPSFRLEKNVVEAEIDVLRALGVEFRCGVEVGKDVTIAQLREQGYQGFYLAIGAQGGRAVGVEGEDADGVQAGVTFMRAVSEGTAEKLSGRTVVVGGGNVAVDVARTAARFGSQSVSMYCLETRDIMPAAADEVAEAEAEGITVNCGWGPAKILTENGKVTGVQFKKCVSVFDAEKKFNPSYDEADTITVECENVLLSIGQSIVWGELLKDTKVELNRNGTVKADAVTYQTAEADIFAGGDIYTGPKFAIDAIAAGREGAVSLHRFVNVGQSLTIGRNRRVFFVLDKDSILLGTDCFDKPARQIPGKDETKKNSFSDERCTFTEEQVKAEASRCLSCGRSVVDPNRCLGCGLCTTRCEFDAIHISRERPECSTMVTSENKMKAILPYMAKRGIRIVRNGKKK